jgi:Serine dehydrogenase proteinase
MGVYSEYLNRDFSFDDLQTERKRQLQAISEHRKRDVLVYAANVSVRQRAPISIEYSDLLPINDQLANLHGDTLDLIIETGGGSGEVAEDIVKLLREKYVDLAAIVPGMAKSAGTLIVMAADDILMEPASALGPIDAQIQWQGKTFSAEALLEGLRAIQRESDKAGRLNLAYLPILQQISPGEIQDAQNALDFAQDLVADWLTKFKFKSWTTHKSGDPVTDAERRDRAQEIAHALSDHGRWFTHGRSIKIADLEAMKLQITDYSSDTALMEAVRRYHTLLQMTFDTNCYKLIETVDSQVYRFTAQPVQSLPGVPFPMLPGVPGPVPGSRPGGVAVGVPCEKCGFVTQIQAKFRPEQPDNPDAIRWPVNNTFKCSQCGTDQDVSGVRAALEGQVGGPVVG